MRLTTEQVLALAPDARSVTTGRQAARAFRWSSSGFSGRAWWGEFEGSSSYRTAVDKGSLSGTCSCPSRKVPCKHALGLLLRVAAGEDLGAAAEPEWVQSWLERRQAASKRAAERKARGTPADLEARQRRREEREQKVQGGIDALELWLADLMRSGMAELPRSPEQLQRQVARMVDAQSRGLAGRLQALAEIVGASEDWPRRALDELGRLTLLLEAYRHPDRLPPGLRHDVRRLVGWSLRREEVTHLGETVRDAWLVVGELEEAIDDRLEARRTWLHGQETGMQALVLQYSAAGQPYAERFEVGTVQGMALAFYPGAVSRRALVVEREGDPEPLRERLPGVDRVDALLDEVAAQTAANPWLSRFLARLHGLRLGWGEVGAPWVVCDGEGVALPLVPGPHWRMLAVSGGGPFDLVGEWSAAGLRPMTVGAGGTLVNLGGGRQA